MKVPASYRDHKWAWNKSKLLRAYQLAEEKKAMEPEFKVTEETVKEIYISLRGRLLEEVETPREIPRVTGSRGLKINSKK